MDVTARGRGMTDTRHPVLTALARFLCRIIGTLFLIPGATAFIRLLFVPPDDFPRRVVGLALAATAGCAAFGFIVLRFMPAKGPPIRFGHQAPQPEPQRAESTNS